jgi:hypothetical protein
MAAPTWTETLLAALTSSGLSVALARNATLVAEFDARSKFKVYFALNIGRTTTTALGTAITVLVRPESRGANAGQYVHGNQAFLTSQVASGQTTTINADVAAGGQTLNVASSASMAAGDIGIIAAGSAREEFYRVARVTDSTHLLLDAPVQYAHTAAQADALFNKGDAFVTPELPGGCFYQIVFDYGAAASGGGVRVWGSAFSLDTIG